MTAPARHSQGTPDLSPRATAMALALILVGRLLLGLAYSALTPLGEAPDEADHFAYAAYIAREGRLPEGTWMTQAKHPPLYYLLAAGVISGAGAEPDFTFLRANPDVGLTPGAPPNFFVHTALESWPWRGGALAMHLGRLVSVLAGLALAASTYALGRRLWPTEQAVALTAAIFAAFLPESLFIGGAMSNDMLAAMWSALALWMAAGRGMGNALAAGLFLGLAIVTKASTALLAPVVAAATLAVNWRRGERRPYSPDSASRWRAIARAATTGAIALAVAAPWLWRNWRLYGDPLGWPLVLATIDRRAGPLTFADLAGLARGWFVSFWGKFGGAGHIPLPTPSYVLWAGLVVAAAAGWLLRARTRGIDGSGRPLAWVILLGAPAMAVLAILAYSRVALGTDQGRLLFPGLAPAALLLAGGLAGWLPRQRRKWLPLGMGIGMVAAGSWALAAGIVAPFAPPPAPSAAKLAAATPVGQAFGNDLELMAVRWDGSQAATAGEGVTLTLYWQARRPLSDDLRTALRLTDAGGNLLWEWKRSPGAGRFSTDRWPANRPVADAYRLPADPLARAARIEVGVRPFPEGEWLAPVLTLPRP